MMKKSTFLKSLLVSALLMAGVNSSWAAGYTRTLSDALSVAGYKAKQFYNFQTNTPDVLPTEGDLRYRAYEKGGYWGLHNYRSGTRSASVSISVKTGELLVLQDYANNTTVNVGELNETLTASTGYRCFNITSDAATITLTCPMNGGVIAALLMEVDGSVATADYSINYKYDGATIKTTAGTEAVGNEVNAESFIWVADVKYKADADQTMSMTITSGTNVLDVNVSKAALYAYTVYASAGSKADKIAAGTLYEGESETVAYPQYKLSGTTLYNVAQGSGDWYRKSITPDKDGYTETIAYSNGTISNVVFYTEAEDIEGASAGANTARASQGMMGYTANSETYKDVTTLAPGKYQIFVRGVNGNSATRTLNIKVGETVVFTFSIPNGINTLGNSEVFTVSETSTLSFACDGSSASGLDWLYIVRTDAIPVTFAEGKTYLTFSSNSAIDLDNLPAGLQAYYASAVSASTITLTEATGSVRAGTGLVLKGAAGTTYGIPVAAGDGSEISGNKLVAVTAVTSIGTSGKDYILKDGKFYKASEGLIEAGKAYIKGDSEAPVLTISFGETTGINAAKAESVKSADIYNLKGQRVSQPTKGLYIVGGKKVVVK